MHEAIAILQVGVVLTTPVFFLVTLLVLWRVVRTTETALAVAIYVKHHLDMLTRGGAGLDAAEEARRAEGRLYSNKAPQGEKGQG